MLATMHVPCTRRIHACISSQLCFPLHFLYLALFLHLVILRQCRLYFVSSWLLFLHIHSSLRPSVANAGLSSMLLWLDSYMLILHELMWMLHLCTNSYLHWFIFLVHVVSMRTFYLVMLPFTFPYHTLFLHLLINPRQVSTVFRVQLLFLQMHSSLHPSEQQIVGHLQCFFDLTCFLHVVIIILLFRPCCYPSTSLNWFPSCCYHYPSLSLCVWYSSTDLWFCIFSTMSLRIDDS